MSGIGIRCVDDIAVIAYCIGWEIRGGLLESADGHGKTILRQNVNKHGRHPFDATETSIAEKTKQYAGMFYHLKTSAAVHGERRRE